MKGYCMSEEIKEEVVTSTTEINEGTQEVDNKVKQEKVFNQEEVNAMIQQRLARAKKDLPNEEELKKFREYQESQKTELEKLQEQNKLLVQEKEAAIKEVQAAQNKSLVVSSGIQSQYVDYAIFEVSKMVTDEIDFNTALEQFKTNNEHYFNVQPQPKTTSTGLGVNKTTTSSAASSFDEEFKKYLKY
jgi:long-subunit acyl-CoA synthetase (AMP-forming)